MGVSMRDVEELITVGNGGEPNFQRIKVKALSRDLEGGSPGGPVVGAGVERFLEFKRCISWPCLVPDWAWVAFIPVDISCRVCVAIAVVANLRVIDGASIHLGLDRWDPVGDLIHVFSIDT